MFNKLSHNKVIPLLMEQENKIGLNLGWIKFGAGF